MKDKIFEFLKKVLNKAIKPLFNKKWKICIWIVLLLVLIVSSIVIKGIPKKYADRAVEFLEDEGYECDIDSEGNDNYLCEYESDNGILHQFSIFWGDGVPAFDLLNGVTGFYINYDLKDGDEKWIFFGDEVFQKNYYGVYAYSYLIDDNECMFVAANWKEDYDNYIDDDTDVVALNDEVCDYKNNCESCLVYEKELNYALDVFREIYEEIDLELYED